MKNFEERNDQLSKEAHRLYKEDRLLDAANLLRQINPTSMLTEKEIEILESAKQYEAFFQPFLSSATGAGNSDANSPWLSLINQKIHGYQTDIQYFMKRDEVNQNDFVLDMKINTLLPDTSLVSPLLALLNESDLYSTWLPYWDLPRIQISQSKQLKQMGRCSQVVQIVLDLPWPVYAREFVLEGVAVDNIDQEDNPNIAIRLKTLHTGDIRDDFVVGAPDPNRVRVDFNGGFLFHQPTSVKGIMLSFFYKFENEGSYYPESLIKFGIRIGAQFGWGRFLKAAEEVRDGQRPLHGDRIIQKRKTLYNWVDERVSILSKE